MRFSRRHIPRLRLADTITSVLLTVLVVGFIGLMVMMFREGCRGEEPSSTSPVEVPKQEPLKLKETDAYAEWRAASKEDRVRLCEKLARQFRRELGSDKTAESYYEAIEVWYRDGNPKHKIRTVAKLWAVME